MKICYLTTSVSRLAGGVHNSLQQLAQNFARLDNVSVDIVALEDKFSYVDKEGWRPLELHSFAIKGPRKLGYSPGMLDFLCELNPDIVHTHGIWTYPSMLAHAWGQTMRRPYIVSPHGMLNTWALSSSKWRKKLAWLLYEKRNLRQAGCIHTLCDAETVAVWRAKLQNPICQIPNGIDLSESTPGKVCSPWPTLTADGKHVMLYLGRIHPKKGLSNLISAWSSLDKGPNSSRSRWVLAIVGWEQGGHEKLLKKLAYKLDIADDILFLGPRFGIEKIACFRHADAFILPSYDEAFPMAILEAWSHRLPVLVTPQCNIPEGYAVNAALMVAPEVKSISAGLYQMMEMPDADRRTMGQNGYTLVMNRYAWPRIVVQMKSVYDWILGGDPPPSCIRFN